MEPTLDPTVFIEERGTADGVPFVRYVNQDGRRWVVRGTCNQCGLCVVGAGVPTDYAWDGPVGTPYAVRDLRVGARLDEPVAPGFIEDMQQMAAETPGATVAGCALTIEDA